MATANTDRVLRDLYTLREIGPYKTGVHRPTLSPQDMEARGWLVDQLSALGHRAQIDGIANVIGRAAGAGPRLLAGSHIESQNHAGWLDGALGVVYALEAARAVAEDPTLEGAVDVIAFADEEGHFGSFLGSRSFAGTLDEAVIDAARDRTRGQSMRDALGDAGLAGIPRETLDPTDYAAFLEAHIEQGNRLETEGLKIGVVTSIVAIWQYRITFTGDQNHAGTTRMATRRDAGKALMQLWHRIEERFPADAGPDTVWTVGHVALTPGAPSIIPGQAEMVVQFRDADGAVLDRLDRLLRDLVMASDDAGPCAARIEVLGQSTPALMAGDVQDALSGAAEALAPGLHLRMPSGAGHDAQVMAPLLPSGMMFVPSIGGISHHWSENTTDADITLGAEVFVEAATRLLRLASGGGPARD